MRNVSDITKDLLLEVKYEDECVGRIYSRFLVRTNKLRNKRLEKLFGKCNLLKG